MSINYDIDGEISLLGTCLMVESCRLDACQTMKCEHFHSPVNKLIFKAISDLYSEGHHVDLDSIASKLNFHGNLERCSDVLCQLKHRSIASNYKLNKKHIIENSKKGEILRLAILLQQDLDTKHINEIATIVSNFDCESSRVKTYDYSDIIDGEFYGEKNAYEWLDAREEAFKRGEEITGITTGFPRLDAMINGLNPGHYVTIAAVPGGGKTTFAIQIMKSLMDLGKTCGFITLEMSRQEVLIKLTSKETGLPYNVIAKGGFDSRQKDDIIHSWQRFGKNKNLKLQDGQVYDLVELKARMKFLVEVKGAKVLFIDYISLINNNKGDNLSEKIKEISSVIRQTLSELQVPGIIISQLNRASSGADRVPQMHDLFGSSQLEKDSHEILMLHPECKLTGRRRLYIRKNRKGPVDAVIKYSFQNGIFEEDEEI